MKQFCVLLSSLIFLNGSFAQWNYLSKLQSQAEDADKTLKSAIGICATSFLSQAIGGSLILAGMDQETDEDIFFLGVGLAMGIGGVGMQTNSAILANRAYQQLKVLKFASQDSLLRARILKNIKSARTLSIIQNVTPILAAVAGAVSFSVHKNRMLDQYYDEAFFESPSFWIPAVSICFAGAILSIPEIVLIGKTRHDLNTYRQKIILGTTKYGIGISYKF